MGRLEDIAARNRPTGPARHSLPPEQMKWVFVGLAVVFGIIFIGGFVSTCNERPAREPAAAPIPKTPSGASCGAMRRELTPLEQQLRQLDPADAGTYCARLQVAAKAAGQGANTYTFMLSHAIALADLAKQCTPAGVAATHAGVRSQAEEIGIEVAVECAGP